MNIPTAAEMMKAGVHFGHKVAKWNPKMEPCIYTVRNGVHIINLDKTAEQLAKAVEAVTKTVRDGGVVLFLGTKKQAREIVTKYAVEAGMPYVTERWLGGTLTNFVEINKLVKKLESMEKRAKEEDYEKKYTKWERGQFEEEMGKLNVVIGGIRGMKKIPEMMFIVGSKDEKTAVLEALNKNVKTVAVVDTNTNPDVVTYPIAANDDATKSIELITKTIAEAVKEARASGVSKVGEVSENSKVNEARNKESEK